MMNHRISLLLVTLWMTASNYRTDAACTLCPDGEGLTVADGSAPLFEGSDETCGAAEATVAGYTDAECEEQEDKFIKANRRRCCTGTYDTLDDIAECSFPVHPFDCTESLIESAPVEAQDCECATYCKGEFVRCLNWPGELEGADVCDNTNRLVGGCNKKLADLYFEDPAREDPDYNITLGSGDGNSGDGAVVGRGFSALAVTVVAAAGLVGGMVY